MDLSSLCFHLIPLSIPWIPGQAPKSAGSGFATPSKHKGETGGPKYLGCATSGASRDAPHLELPQLDIPTAGGGPSSQGRVRLRDLPSPPGNPSPPHPAAPTPATLHSHSSGVSTSRYPKKPTKREKRSLQASTQNPASPNMCPSPLHTLHSRV